MRFTRLASDLNGGWRNRAYALVLLVLAFALSGCGGARPATPAAKPIEYAVPVQVGCVAPSGRPAKPQALNRRYTADQWAALPPGSKGQAAAAQAGKRLNYEDELAASTAGCE